MDTDDECVAQALRLGFGVTEVHPNAEYQFTYHEGYITYWPRKGKWRTPRSVIKEGYESLRKHLTDLASKETMKLDGFYWMKKRVA